ncbi:tetratricopeptide repeat protein [Proteiniphilum acetatigenes]|uniref:tetratricopeptide repeat protein n=1 Tax=Proteiniphilum acetatigenes TaxID=294710 RepID=UPI0003756BE1|nr:tetratricopeptide repeat protein [Proteiniphilum acetatigenes]SFL39265.1 Tetratricopeptide repeat-containing protein [Porphyromonadaceae bacterium KH3CP3RA]
MKRTILFIILLIASSSLFLSYGQNAKAEELIQEGVELHDEGEFKEAIEKYNEALTVDPKSVHATYELSLSYLALQDYLNASKYSTQVINSGNKQLSSGAYAVKSEALAGLDKVDEAIALLQEGLIKNGDEFLLHFNLALNYYKRGDIDKTLEHVKKAIDLDKSHSGAFLLNAYALNDSGLWVQSILSFQMFLLLEPDSKRSKSAFEEMLNIMRIKTAEEPVQRSFIQQQMMRNNPDTIPQSDKIPPLSIEDGLNRNFVYHAITTTLDSLKNSSEEKDDFILFKTVNKEIMNVLTRESKGAKEGVFWTFYIPFFSHIAESDYYDTFCRYISVSYFPESMEWWQQNPGDAVDFVIWFEKGDED